LELLIYIKRICGGERKGRRSIFGEIDRLPVRYFRGIQVGQQLKGRSNSYYQETSEEDKL